jgi:hypothetical protein
VWVLSKFQAVLDFLPSALVLPYLLKMHKSIRKRAMKKKAKKAAEAAEK